MAAEKYARKNPDSGHGELRLSRSRHAVGQGPRAMPPTPISCGSEPRYCSLEHFYLDWLRKRVAGIIIMSAG